MALARSKEACRRQITDFKLCCLTSVMLFALTVTAGAQTGRTGPDAIATTAAPTLAPLVRKVAPSVVNIIVKGRIAQELNPLLTDPFYQKFFDIADESVSVQPNPAGSGVIIDRQGVIVTNNHIVEHAEAVSVVLADGRHLEARRVGSDPDSDVAIVRVAAEGLTAIPLGNSDKLESGDYVVAIGNPFGAGQTVTQGVVGALRRAGRSIDGYEDFIQTDVRMNPGNSGGALVNLSGELVGINTDIAKSQAGNDGIGFAIPINLIRETIDQLIRYGEVRRGRLTIAVRQLTPELADTIGLPSGQCGVAVARVEEASAPERAGLKIGDVITAIAKAPIRSASDFRNAVGWLHVGDIVELAVLRAGEAVVIRTALTMPTRSIRGGRISHLLEGVAFGPVTAEPPMQGVELVSVRAGSRAARSGLRKGDVITMVNQKHVAGLDDFALIEINARALALAIVRDGRTLLVVLQ